MGSGKFSLSNEDMKSTLINSAIYGGGMAAIYAVESIARWDFGIWSPMFGIGAGIVIKILNKWIADNTKQNK